MCVQVIQYLSNNSFITVITNTVRIQYFDNKSVCEVARLVSRTFLTSCKLQIKRKLYNVQ